LQASPRPCLQAPCGSRGRWTAGLRRERGLLLDVVLALHVEEGAVDEVEGDEDEDDSDPRGDGAEAVADGNLHRQDAKEGGELDDGVEGDGAGVLVGVADGVADDAGLMERGALGLEVDLDDLLGIVPRAACIGHEDGLEEAEDGDAEQVADKHADGLIASYAVG